jgi:hypothetical protein
VYAPVQTDHLKAGGSAVGFGQTSCRPRRCFEVLCVEREAGAGRHAGCTIFDQERECVSYSNSSARHRRQQRVCVRWSWSSGPRGDQAERTSTLSCWRWRLESGDADVSAE